MRREILPARASRACLSLIFVLPGVSGQLCHADNTPAQKAAPRKAVQKPSAASVFRGEDVVATVEGQPITRRELTYYWLQVDSQGPDKLLFGLLTDRWKASKGAARAYTISDAEIYRRLYTGSDAIVGDILSSLISNRLVAIVANRQGIRVTRAEALAYAHDLLEQFRAQSGSKEDDTTLIKRFRLPLDVFLEDMTYRVRIEKMLGAEIARKNGHPIGPDDWVLLRQYRQPVAQGTTQTATEQGFTDAKTQIDQTYATVRVALLQPGADRRSILMKSLPDVRGPALRGTGTKSIEDAIARLKPGEVSPPQRTTDGWYLFAREASGRELPEAQRHQAWLAVVAAKTPQFLIELRQHAKITSVIKLPPMTLPTPGAANSAAQTGATGSPTN